MNSRTIIVLLLAALLATACAASTSSGLSPAVAQPAATPTATPTAAPPAQPPTAEPTIGSGLLPAQEADIARFDAGAPSGLVRPLEDRAPIPSGAVAAFSIDSYFEPGEADALDAAAEAARTAHQVVVVADVSGCVLMTAWALPGPDEVVVGYEWADVDCAVAVDFHLVFLIDDVGTSAAGDYDYRSTVPPTRLEIQVA